MFRTLRGHLQAVQTHKIKIIIPNITLRAILISQSCCCTMHVNKTVNVTAHLHNKIRNNYAVVLISGALSPQRGASSGCGWWNELRIHWISSSGQPTRGSPSAWELGEVLIAPHSKKLNMLRNISKGLRLGLALWNNASGGKDTWEWDELGMWNVWETR
jgi:hypothetical protein